MDPSMLLMLLPMLMPILQQMMGGGAGGGGTSPATMAQLQQAGFSPSVLANIGITPGAGGGGSSSGGMDFASMMPSIMKMMAGVSQVPYANQGESAIDQGMGMLTDPSKFMGLVTHLSTPLNAQLVKAVQSGAQGSAAEAGLGQSAGAVSSATARALAPYEQANQENAQQTAMSMIQQMLGNAQQFGAPYKNLMNLFGGSGGSSGGSLF